LLCVLNHRNDVMRPDRVAENIGLLFTDLLDHSFDIVDHGLIFLL